MSFRSMAWSTISKAFDRSSATRMDLWAGLVLFSPSVMKVLISHSAVVVRSSQQLGLRTGIDAGELLLPKDCQSPQVHVCIHSIYTHIPFFLFLLVAVGVVAIKSDPCFC